MARANKKKRAGSSHDKQGTSKQETSVASGPASSKEPGQRSRQASVGASNAVVAPEPQKAATSSGSHAIPDNAESIRKGAIGKDAAASSGQRTHARPQGAQGKGKKGDKSAMEAPAAPAKPTEPTKGKSEGETPSSQHPEKPSSKRSVIRILQRRNRSRSRGPFSPAPTVEKSNVSSKKERDVPHQQCRTIAQNSQSMRQPSTTAVYPKSTVLPVPTPAPVTSQTPESASRKDKHRKRAGSQSVQDPPEEAVDAAKEIVDKAESQKTFQDVEAVQESTAPVISTSSKAPEARPIKTVRDEKCPFETTLAQATRRIPFGESASTQLVVSRKNAQIGTIPVAVECGLLTELDELYMSLQPTEGVSQRKHAFVRKLENLLKGEWPNETFSVHAFGSTENHLGTDTSDLDVCIVTSEQSLAKRICRLAMFMHDSGMKNVVCRAGAKVPVVAVFDPELEVACDMNINNKLALRNTRLVRTYMEIDARARQLAYLVKHWAKCRALNDAVSNTLTSYSWTLLVINFLQVRQPPVLPCLHSWPHDPVEPIQGIDVSFADDVEKFGLRGFGRHNHESIASLLFGFFHYYTYVFNYDAGVASVRSGGVIDRFSTGFRPDHKFGIEEPFTVSRNLGNTADVFSYRGIHMELARAHDLLADGHPFEAACELYLMKSKEGCRQLYEVRQPTKPSESRQPLHQAHSRTAGRAGLYRPAKEADNPLITGLLTDFRAINRHNAEYHIGQGILLEHLQFLQTGYPLSLRYFQQINSLVDVSRYRERRQSQSLDGRVQDFRHREQPLKNQHDWQAQRCQPKRSFRSSEQFTAQQARQQYQTPVHLTRGRSDNSIRRRECERGRIPSQFPQPLLYPLQARQAPGSNFGVSSGAKLNGYIDSIMPFQSGSVLDNDTLLRDLNPSAVQNRSAEDGRPNDPKHGSEYSDSSTTMTTHGTSSQSSPTSSPQHSPATSVIMPFQNQTKSGMQLPLLDLESNAQFNDNHELGPSGSKCRAQSSYGFVASLQTPDSPPNRRNSQTHGNADFPHTLCRPTLKPSYARVASQPSSPAKQGRTQPPATRLRTSVC